MEPSYHILYKEGQGEVVEKKSRFIANIFPVNTDEEAQERNVNIKKKQNNDRHGDVYKRQMMPGTIVLPMLSERKMRSCAAVMTENRRERQDGRCWKY